MRADRWEHGSDFAYPDLAPDAPRAEWLPPRATYWHSGRHALRALLRALRPSRVLFPSFYCQDVLDAADGVEVRAYALGPEDARVDAASLDLRPGDVLVVTNTFGLRAAPPIELVPDGVVLVEDHTHDPMSAWARSSTADFAFASLRKWLPVPDGGVLWSPRGEAVPEPPTFDPERHARFASITLDRLTGMLLKQRYLGGEAVSKDAFRARAIAGEAAIGRGDPAPMSPVSRAFLDVLPAPAWRAVRASNHDAFASALAELPGARLLTSTSGGRVPYAAVLCFDDPAKRDAVRSRLVEQRIYPAVLWPIDADRAPGIPPAHVELSRRILCIHCDHRYGPSDMERVAACVRGAA
jgi:hypothetical protein